MHAIFTLLATTQGTLEQLEMRQCWLTSTFTVTHRPHELAAPAGAGGPVPADPAGAPEPHPAGAAAAGASAPERCGRQHAADVHRFQRDLQRAAGALRCQRLPRWAAAAGHWPAGAAGDAEPERSQRRGGRRAPVPDDTDAAGASGPLRNAGSAAAAAERRKRAARAGSQLRPRSRGGPGVASGGPDAAPAGECSPSTHSASAAWRRSRR